jgi:primosomal replication protein N
VKNALKNPDKYTPAELKFFEIWLNHRKEQKSAKKGNTLQ